MERIIRGRSVSAGIAEGTVRLLTKKRIMVTRHRVDDPESEIARFEAARDVAREEMREVHRRALKEVGEANAAIFEAHIMILDDPVLTDSVYNIIRTQSINAEVAVAMTADNYSELFSSMEDELMKGRGADVLDVSERILTAFHGEESGTDDVSDPVIIASDGLSPSETVRLDKSKVLAIVTRKGSASSHTAILAHSMGIPAVMGADFPSDIDGCNAIADGSEGCFIIDPEPQTIEDYRRKKAESDERKRMLSELKGKDNVTSDGRRIDIFANAGAAADVAEILSNDAGGIGLFRSEFLFMQKDTAPTEDEQFNFFRKTLELMAGKRVIVRTLDIGSDKLLPFCERSKENLSGLRGIRFSLKEGTLFKTQLRALLRASYYGSLSVMYPMIATLEELLAAKEVFAEAKRELDSEGILYSKDIRQGIMIETPAAAEISDLLAKEADFFSIGTNDLIQYTLCVDRNNPAAADYFDVHHPAVLRLIRKVIENAHDAGIRVGICGDTAYDTSLLPEFLDMGADSLSVPPTEILPLRAEVRGM